jgi:hypothetical protein
MSGKASLGGVGIAEISLGCSAPCRRFGRSDRGRSTRNRTARTMGRIYTQRSDIKGCLSLRSAIRTRICGQAQSFRAPGAPFIETELYTLPYKWGPGGSVGYELVSRIPVVTRESDLDLIVSAPEPFDRQFGGAVMHRIAAAPGKVDVRVETSWCGFSLEEYSRQCGERFLVRTPAGPRLTDDPWSFVPESSQ